ncbi:DNA (cytosine-5)-methyltransferase DRM2-like [Apium graveolens]|uniref:DNA (cytosine-5)-methyltransferase DRM2-like n=1 Tax=Apium graveolens TaxID=4045 RepID=UPI003D7C0E0E
MDDNASNDESCNIDWDTDDEREIENLVPSSSSIFPVPNGDVNAGSGEGCSSAVSTKVRLIYDMKFPEDLVLKAIEQHGEEDPFESILNTVLSLQAIQSSPEQQQCGNSGRCSSGYDDDFLDDLSDSDSWCGSNMANTTCTSKVEDKRLLALMNMDFSVAEASIAIDRCGPEASIAELTDFITAAQMAKADEVFFKDPPDESKSKHSEKKRKLYELEMLKKRKNGAHLAEDKETIRFPKPMVGFGAPTEVGSLVLHRNLPEEATGPPYFYYENVALAPKGVWDTISSFLYDVQPEFVDSKFFSAAARKRGYVHNLPIDKRSPLLPLPPKTIHDALPMTRRWWPSWDTRTKLNCLQTCIASATLTNRIRKALEGYENDPPMNVQKFVIDECKKWNLVWVGRNKVAPLECDEVEMLLGFPKNHTRGGGISRTDRYKSLGNSFQVDTVAYHLSVLRDIFPGGINLLSLFSGIGGAEVALHRLGIRLKNVVSVEISEANQNVVRSWWEQTNQKGNLIHIADVQKLNGDKLEEFMASFGGFDLVVGGSPCNNLAGSNRHHRDGLEGEHSSLFYDYFRILDLVKGMMRGQQQSRV